MTATTMHFGPEWMRTKSSHASSTTSGQSPASGASFPTLSPALQPDEPAATQGPHILQYSKEELLRIYRTLAKTTLPPDVEKWEGVVRDTPSEPISLREMSETEKRLFSGPLNSELRRRQSSDYLSPLNTQNPSAGDRSRLNPASLSPLRDRFGSSMMKRRESTDQVPPRKLSLTGSQPPASSRDNALPSPRTRYGGTGFDGVFNSGETWGVRRRVSEGLLKAGLLQEPDGGMHIREEDEMMPSTNGPLSITSLDAQPSLENGVNTVLGPPPGLDFANIEWSYLDPQGQTQGPFRAELMQKWHEDGYFTPDLPMKRPAIDKDWITFGALSAQSIGQKIFLSAFPPIPPPPPPIPPQTLLAQDPQLLPTTYHPSPIRTLRAPTLDSFAIGSTSSSPASSFGAGRFGNASPDASAFGGRVSNSYSSNDPIYGSRVGSFTAESTLSRRRSTLPEGVDGVPNSTSLGNLVHRTGSTDSFTYNGPSINPWTPHSHDSIPLSSSFTKPPSRSSFIPEETSFGDPSAGNVPFDYGSFVDVPQSVSTEVIDLAAKHSFPATSLPAQLASSAWAPTAEVTELKRPGPFDAKHPKSSNTIAISPNVTSEPPPSKVHTEPLPIAPGNRLPSYQLEKQEENVVTKTELPQTHTPVAVPSKKPKKSSTQPSVPVTSPQLPPAPTSDSHAAPAAAPKAAWSKPDDKKKPSGVSLSLREIQEAELKKAEARKAAERERDRDRAARAAANPNAEDLTVLTTSWGLASSQAGTRLAATKDSPIAQSPSTPSATPVWTNAAKPAVLRSMKEIQEEEEKRKKTTPKETAAAIASRKLQAEPSSQKGSASPAQSAWTTIGPGGKPNPAARPPAIAPASSSSSPSVPKANGGPPSTSRPPNSSSKVSSPSGPKPDDIPNPSPEFIKWLSDSLKGLNSSVKVEEIMAMLLSFALDPDPSTIELISDLIYANSTTLDGRRFASEFIMRRKADAATSRKGPGGGVTTASGGKPISIADVVKAQPKPPASAEWGFKVVNKKKKGGRS